MDNIIIQISNLSAYYSKNIILDNISLDIKKGDSICILGENSSGKSTLLKCICKLKKYTGNIKYKKDLKIFYLPQDNILIDDLNVNDNINLFLKDYDKSEYINILYEFNINDILKKKVKDLSGGTKRKVSLCIALLEKCDILILDEAFVSLDVNIRNIFLNKFKEKIRKDISIIYTTHLNDTISLASRRLYLKNNTLLEG